MGRKKKEKPGIAEASNREDFRQRLGIDERDELILALVQKNPRIAQEEIATKIKLSQPSVGARLKRLEKNGILQQSLGVNFKVVNLYLAKVDITSTNTGDVIDAFKDCPFYLNALVTSGRYNLCLLFMATDLKRLEQIVNYHLRGNPKIKDVELNIVIATAKDLILPLNIDYENKVQQNCKENCRACPL